MVRHPRILGLQFPNTIFIIPLEVVEELGSRTSQRGKSFDRRIDLINEAAAEGTVELVNTELPHFKRFEEVLSSPKLSGADRSILTTALTYKDKGERVLIATQDKEIIKHALLNKIEVLTIEHIGNLLSAFTTPTTKEPTIQSAIVSYEDKEKRNFYTGILFGIVATLIVIFIYNSFEKILFTINVWGTIILILICGIALFVFREKSKLSYGVFEFLVGVVAIIAIFYPINFDFKALAFNFDFYLKLLGGLYIMVRGQDNIVRALKDTKAGLYLKDKFDIGN
ncbi:MAG: hypothetical protein NVS1B13_17640 [Flavisolibacter sp.]